MNSDSALRLVARADRQRDGNGHIVRDHLQQVTLRLQQKASCRNLTHHFRVPEEDLASVAAELLAMRRRRDDSLPSRLLGEAAWDILLVAYSSPNEIIQTKELCASSPTPEATTIRWLQVLERNGFLEKAVHPIRHDHRATYYRLTPHGRAKVGQALEAMLHD